MCKRQLQQEEKDNENKKEEVIRQFFKLIEQKVLKDKNPFILIYLLGHISDLSEEEGLEPVATSVKSLQRIIETNFEKMVSFHIVGKRLIYSLDVNQCIYVTATLKGCGLCDDGLTRAFAKMVQKKISKSKQKWPLSAEELIESLDSTGPFQHIYNAIVWSLHPEHTQMNMGTSKHLQKMRIQSSEEFLATGNH